MRIYRFAAVAILTQLFLPVRAECEPKDALVPNLSLLGVRLEEDSLEGVQSRLGQNRIQHNGGDAAGSVHFICYVGRDNTALFLTSGEIDGGQVGGFQLLTAVADVDLSAEGFRRSPSLVPQCSQLPKLSRATVTAGGLKLGMTPRQVEAHLGKPDNRTADQMIWKTQMTVPRIFNASTGPLNGRGKGAIQCRVMDPRAKTDLALSQRQTGLDRRVSTHVELNPQTVRPFTGRLRTAYQCQRSGLGAVCAISRADTRT